MKRTLLVLLLLIGAGGIRRAVAWPPPDPPSVCNDTVAQWYLNDDAANKMVIEHGRNYDGTSNRNTADMAVTGKILGALNFDGDVAQDYFTAGGASDWTFLSDGSEWSVAFWINKESITGADTILATCRNDYGATGIIIELKEGVGSNKYRCLVMNGSGSAYGMVSEMTYHGTGFHHVVITFDGTDLKWYFDGAIEVWSIGAGGSFSSSNPSGGELCVGASWTDSGHTTRGGYLHGALDDLRIIDRAITATETEDLYNSGDGLEGCPFGSLADAIWIPICVAMSGSGIVAVGDKMAFDAIRLYGTNIVMTRRLTIREDLFAQNIYAWNGGSIFIGNEEIDSARIAEWDAGADHTDFTEDATMLSASGFTVGQLISIDNGIMSLADADTRFADGVVVAVPTGDEIKIADQGVLEISVDDETIVVGQRLFLSRTAGLATGLGEDLQDRSQEIGTALEASSVAGAIQVLVNLARGLEGIN